jgi:hypothetical protein
MTDMQIKQEGFRALMDALGKVDAERFVVLIQRERFDYTEWQRTLWPEKSIQQISQAATEHRRQPADGQ